jgi:hypothetical protein
MSTVSWNVPANESASTRPCPGPMTSGARPMMIVSQAAIHAATGPVHTTGVAAVEHDVVGEDHAAVGETVALARLTQCHSPR